jgi:hypothetical protein
MITAQCEPFQKMTRVLCTLIDARSSGHWKNEKSDTVRLKSPEAED